MEPYVPVFDKIDDVAQSEQEIDVEDVEESIHLVTMPNRNRDQLRDNVNFNNYPN